jgi:hypothetical protein
MNVRRLQILSIGTYHFYMIFCQKIMCFRGQLSVHFRYIPVFSRYILGLKTG